MIRIIYNRKNGDKIIIIIDLSASFVTSNQLDKTIV